MVSGLAHCSSSFPIWNKAQRSMMIHDDAFPVLPGNSRMHTLKVPGVRSYRDLVAWQKAMKLVADVYRCTEFFPKAEMYGLTAQLRRAAVSVPSNIAEGQGRAST